MTMQEVCEKYNVAESCMKTAFPKTQKSILKKHGVKIIKEGRGKEATYREEWVDDKRAISMYNETKDVMIMDSESLKLMSWDFMVLLAIVTTPMLVFRGSFIDFLKYVELSVTESNLKNLKKALSSLEERDIISYSLDKTDINYFVAALYRKVEIEMQIGLGMVQTCKILAKKYRKQSWVPLLKTWLGAQMMVDRQPYTIGDLQRVTGLTEYQIKSSSKILRESKIFRTSRAYISFNKCIGSYIDLNVEAFYELGKRE